MSYAEEQMGLVPTDAAGNSGAIFSPCEVYRYRLWRRWAPGETITWVLLNPSTADEVVNDPTISRCLQRSRDAGYGQALVVNLFGFRATNPEEMLAAESPTGPDNNQHILAAARDADRVVCGWGGAGNHMGRAAEVEAMLRAQGIDLYCLGTTQGGDPRHPLYVAYAQGFEVPGVDRDA